MTVIVAGSGPFPGCTPGTLAALPVADAPSRLAGASGARVGASTRADRDPLPDAAAMTVIVAGFGFRPGCDATELLALLAEATRMAGCAPSLLSVPWFRAGGIAMSLAEKTGLELVVMEREAILAVQPSCPTRSLPALRAHGIGAVAEGCALAAAGAGAVLRLPRIGSGNATCAIAHAPVGSNA